MRFILSRPVVGVAILLHPSRVGDVSAGVRTMMLRLSVRILGSLRERDQSQGWRQGCGDLVLKKSWKICDHAGVRICREGRAVRLLNSLFVLKHHYFHPESSRSFVYDLVEQEF